MPSESISVDTLIVGAGVIGSSVAMHLSARGVPCTVIDPDLEGPLSSSELNAGGVRATWGQDVNIEASKLSIGYYASVADEVGYRPLGYLWMFSPQKFESALKIREIHLKHGWNVEAWDVPTLRNKRDFIDKTDDLGGALFSPKDGLVNPNLLKLHYRARAKSAGAVLMDRTAMIGAQVAQGGVQVTCRTWAQTDSDQEFLLASDQIKRAKLANGQFKDILIQAKRVVNCAGAWAPQVSKMLGTYCPSKPVRRQVCIFDSRDVDLTPYGMMIDPSGVYFHPEAASGLAGFLTPNEPDGINFEYDGESFFMEHIWPALYERSTKFERLKHITGWAGLYEVSPDESAIMGHCVGAGTTSDRLFEAHSFSGHGVMHSFSAGLGLAELMISKKFQTVDLSMFSCARFDQGKLLSEGWVI